MRLRSLPLLVICAAGFTMTSLGSAAGLGGVASTSLLAQAALGAPTVPTLVAWENFDGANGAAIAGTSTDVGAKSWTAPRCTWSVSSNRARSTNGDCPLIINSAVVNESAEVRLFRNGATTWDAGIIVNGNAGATRFLTVEFTSASNGSLELWKYNGGWTSLGTVTNLYPGGVAATPTAITLRITSAAPVPPATTSDISISVDGTVRLTRTLSPTDQSLLKAAAQTYVGAYTYNDSTSSFDTFLAETP